MPHNDLIDPSNKRTLAFITCSNSFSNQAIEGYKKVVNFVAIKQLRQ